MIVAVDASGFAAAAGFGGTRALLPSNQPPAGSLVSAIVVRPPEAAAVPLIVAVPHAGTLLPAEFAAGLSVGHDVLRALEDPFVDRLAAGAPAQGAWSLETGWARAVADVNRAADELDPSHFAPPLVGRWQPSAKARAGLGVVPTHVLGRPLYRARPSRIEVERRLALAHRPYHDALHSLLERLCVRFGRAVVLDLHSMPETAQLGSDGVDVALGDRYGRAADERWVRLVQEVLTDAGLRVGRNRPYAGGYVTETYGRPQRGVHVVQLEFRRRLYMNEATFTPHEGLARLRAVCDRLFAALAGALQDAAPGPLAIAGE